MGFCGPLSAETAVKPAKSAKIVTLAILTGRRIAWRTEHRAIPEQIAMKRFPITFKCPFISWSQFISISEQGDVSAMPLAQPPKLLEILELAVNLASSESIVFWNTEGG